MKTLTLQQGSSEWLAHRRTVRNASDAPAMMGASPYVSRADLVRQRATGIEREIDAPTQARFDRGHEVEPALRALAEKIIGEDLYPVTGVADDGYMGASFDGVTLGEDIIFEAKQHNTEKRACMYRGEIPPADYWQVVQQFAVCASATQCLYLCGDGTEGNTAQLWIERAQVEADIPKLIAGWWQFDADVAAYQPEPAQAPAAVGRAPDALPALSVVARGMVEHSNHLEFRVQALAAIAAVNRDLQTDDDFATAELTVKAFKAGEDMLEATRAQILGQMADVNEVMRTIDDVQAELRRVRLDLDKLVTREKESRKTEIVQAGVEAVRAHYTTINATLGAHALQQPSTLTSFIGSAIKGKRTIATMRDAVDAAVAQLKIDASQVAERVRGCVAVLAEFADHAPLFADHVQLCAVKQPDDLRNLARARVAEHEQREAERLERERERIRREEAERLEREQRAAEAAKAAPPANEFSMPPTDAKPCGPDAGETIPMRPAANGCADGLPSVGGATIAPSVRLKLGDINAALAPLSISADGLTQLGFKPVASRGAAKLYAGADFPAICAKLQQVIAAAPTRLQLQDAA